jgi:hypothetical protein
MFTCLFCGLSNPSEKARFCNECGPNSPSKDWLPDDIDQPEKATQYVSMLSEFYFDAQDASEVEKFSIRLRQRLKISFDTHQSVLEKLAQQKKSIEHLANFRFEFNENVLDAYAGHDTFLNFRYTNLSEEDLFKVSLFWDDPTTSDRIDLKAETKSFVKPLTSVTIGASAIFDRIGIKELTDLQITITDQFGESAKFRAEPFSFKVGNHAQQITQHISTHNQISIEGRGVVDASGLGVSKSKNEIAQDLEPNWKLLHCAYILDHSKLDNYFSNNIEKISINKNSTKASQANASFSPSKLTLNAQITDVLVEALNQVGMEGIIKIGASNSNNYEIELLADMHIDVGYKLSSMAKNSQNNPIYLDNPYLLFLDLQLTEPRDLSHLKDLFENLREADLPLIIFAQDVGQKVLEILEIKAERVSNNFVVIDISELAANRKKIIQDISILTGGVMIEYLTHNLNNLNVLGQARYVEITNKRTTIKDGAGKASDIIERVREIKIEVELAESETIRSFHQERIAKLAGGIALVKIPVSNETELNETSYFILNSLDIVRAAIKDGKIKTVEELRGFINQTFCIST